MGDQNVNNFGSFNNSYQYNGDISLTSLDIDGLASEDALARRVVSDQKERRVKKFGLVSLLTLVLVALGYVFFLRRGQMTVADLFSDVASTATPMLVAAVVSWVAALMSGASAIGILRNPSAVEIDNRDRIPTIKHIALSKGFSEKEWRAAKRRAKHA